MGSISGGKSRTKQKGTTTNTPYFTSTPYSYIDYGYNAPVSAPTSAPVAPVGGGPFDLLRRSSLAGDVTEGLGGLFGRRLGGGGRGGPRLVLDPSIRSIEDELLGLQREGLDEFLTRTRAARDRLTGLESPLLQARLEPARAAAAAVQRSVGLRGLSGSSFGDQALFNAAREVGQAGALASADILSAETGLDKDIINAILGTSNLPLEIARLRLEQELRSFGLGGVSNQRGTTSTGSLGFNLGFSGPAPGGGSPY